MAPVTNRNQHRPQATSVPRTRHRAHVEDNSRCGKDTRHCPPALTALTLHAFDAFTEAHPGRLTSAHGYLAESLNIRLSDGVIIMPLPSKQLNDLRLQIDNHEARIQHLRSAIQRMTHQLHRHEQIVELATNPALLRLLSELLEDPDALTEASTDPHAFARDRGVVLPDDLTVQVVAQKSRMTITARFDDETFPAELTWDQERGFHGHT
jgi:hypothetical protein